VFQALKLKFTKRAARNLAAIGNRLRPLNPAGAENVEASIHDSLQNLLLFPLMGREQKLRGVRKVLTPRYSYLIYYRFDDLSGTITILSVKHHAQMREHEET